MELLQLKYFCNSAESENFSKTAKKFLVPTSDISQSIKRLEKELGKPLFNRSANSIRLNENGRLFYSHAKKALAELETAVCRLKGAEADGELRICIKINRRIVMQTVENFRIKYPQVNMIVRYGGEPENESFDLLITADDLSHKGYISQNILSEEIGLAVRRDSPLAKKEHLTAAELKGQPFITMNSGNNLHSVTQQVCNSLGFVPRIAIQSDDPFYIRRCVELGLGVSIVPLFSWKGQFSKDIIIKKLNGMKRKTYVCRKKDRKLSFLTQEFIKMLILECEKEEQ